MAINVQPGTNSHVAVGGSAIEAVPANPQGGIITNPLTQADQGVTTVEPLYVCPCGDATTQANNITFALEPGESWTIIPGQVSKTTVNAVSTGHKFSVVWW